MPRQKNPDELSATDAIALLGTYKKHFYDLIRAGHVKQHFRTYERKRPYYLRSELEELKQRLSQNGDDTGQ